ncbi:hypothetical protein ACFQY8_00530 [Alloscardovia venturai]|uniref:Serine hydrolase n=1 Tax=Alloscardovia venturai TaxID=1769421 RepID=A0ABW2Y1W4_9BIFI
MNYYVNPTNSFIQQMLSPSGIGTYTKAGWIDDDQYFLAQNDAGIVKSRQGDYVIAVMSTAYERYDALSSLVSALDAAHDSDMVK